MKVVRNNSGLGEYILAGRFVRVENETGSVDRRRQVSQGAVNRVVRSSSGLVEYIDIKKRYQI